MNIIQGDLYPDAIAAESMPTLSPRWRWATEQAGRIPGLRGESKREAIRRWFKLAREAVEEAIRNG